ncbi:hypothetical protein M998_0755 [Providencia heimbachae ATCC 35613]|uniref:Uncharacterized protein n=1 Tax=Providencia heimbachae ATCC 35613 TaxID=1354272 RepID=A0A1B7K180_9GAMM|nr:hypothetical protein M998_0755 [Providencia heimbachae ATCC 35613]
MEIKKTAINGGFKRNKMEPREIQDQADNTLKLPPYNI